MKKLYLLICILITQGCYLGPYTNVIEKHQNGKKKTVEYSREKGSLVYKKEVYGDNGILSKKYLYYPSGQIKTYMQDAINIIGDGEYIEYYENGEISEIVRLKEGNVSERGKYNDGSDYAGYPLKVGKWEYFYENGQIKSTGMMDEWGAYGKWVDYYENGQTKREGTYEDGEEVDRKCWDEDGNECECSENWSKGCK